MTAMLPGASADTTSVPSTMAPVIPHRGSLLPLGVDQVHLDGGFWGTRQEINRSATFAHIEHWLEREGWLRNFDLVAAGADMAGRRGREFSDSEVYKFLEAMAWELGARPDTELELCFILIVGRVAAAQDEDGYISTRFGHAGQQSRYSDMEWGHELYCMGHLIQAGVARARTAGLDDRLVTVARAAADHVCDTFGPDGLDKICGHAEIEVALAELGRVTQDERYTHQAALFVDRHGNGTLADIEFGQAYFQDDVPVREATVLRGHAVRANYLTAGAIDVAIDLGDRDLLDAAVAQHSAALARRTYITGGQGSHHQDEGFGEDFVLPPDRAYSETCASVASMMVNWRLLLATGDVFYADAIERLLYNVVATSPADDGRSFYYANTLHQRTPGQVPAQDVASARASSSLRAPWFEVSCCPCNIARTLASLNALVATATDDGVQIHQYVTGTVDHVLPSGGRVRLRTETDYPRSGAVRVVVEEAPQTGWELQLRVPGWAGDGALISADGQSPVTVSPGAVVVEGPGAGGTVILELPMEPRFSHADPRVDAVRGCVAVERGPEVWCVESVDLSGADVADVLVDLRHEPRDDGQRVVVRGALETHVEGASPYGAPNQSSSSAPLDIQLVPYHQWARRGPSTMRVWMPVRSTT